MLVEQAEEAEGRERAAAGELERVRAEAKQLEEELGAECEKNFLTYHDNEENKARVAELEKQLGAAREQLERLTALPIQSFGVSSPQKEQTFCNNTSIMV